MTWGLPEMTPGEGPWYHMLFSWINEVAVEAVGAYCWERWP
ncbi:hypothetical protein [Pontibacter indicus]|nr:hypothetical protein [Pontibacter indicus]